MVDLGWEYWVGCFLIEVCEKLMVCYCTTSNWAYHTLLKPNFGASTLGQPHHISKPLGPNNRTSIWMSSLRVAIYTLINKSSKMLCTTTASLSNYSWYSATNLVCLREISSSWGDLICVIIPRTTTSQEQFPQNTVKLKAITLIHSTHRYEISLHLS